MSASLEQATMNLDFESSEWLDVLEAAIYLRVFKKNSKEPSPETIRNMVNQGKIPFYKPFGRLLFKVAELRQVVESSRNKGGKYVRK